MSLKKNPSPMASSLSKLTLIYQITGLQYFSANAESLESKHTNNGLSRKSKFYLVINFTLLMVEFGGVFMTIHSTKQTLKQSGITTGIVILMIVYGLVTIVIGISMLNSLMLRGKAKEIFTNCHKISELLSVLNRGADYAAFEYEFKKTMATFFVNFTISNLSYIIYTYLYGTALTFSWAIVSVYPYLFMNVIFSYWTLLVRLILENLRFIKQSLAHLHKKHKLFQIQYPEQYSHDLRLRRNQEIFNFIAKLKRIYAIIYDSTALVNELIGIPICVYMVFLVMANISAGYRVFLWYRGAIPLVHIAVSVCTIWTSITTLCTLISSCSSTYKTIDDILTQIHKFEFKKSERPTGIPSMLFEFACQIIQRPIEFRVGGFYCLTQPFLATIVTGVLTYVLILVQFYTA